MCVFVLLCCCTEGSGCGANRGVWLSDYGTGSASIVMLVVDTVSICKGLMSVYSCGPVL